ncbi:hypothetical protein ACN4EK_01150 [Pantanalinema rosaneae CENA516]|uniref:hypothetical protein n=1 Tax=Pantanalinema rosaneae TaxID=1620701 RepID=UPI003D6F4C12
MTEGDKPEEKVNPQQTALGCIILMLLVGSPFVACSIFSSQKDYESPSTTTSIINVPVSERTPEQNLALVDGKSWQGAEQPYASLLDQLGSKCNEDRTAIADMTVVAVKLIKNNGKSTDNLDMLTGLRNATEDQNRQSCKEMYTLLIGAMIGSK